MYYMTAWFHLWPRFDDLESFEIVLTDLRCYTVQLQYKIYNTLNIHYLMLTTYILELCFKEEPFDNFRFFSIRTIISSS